MLLVTSLTLGIAALHSPRAWAQDEGADAGEESGDAHSDIEDGAVVEETHNPAEAGDTVEGPEPGEAVPDGAGAPPPRQPPNANRWRQRDKQAEGTKAQRRSGKDLVIHSQYELNGRKLEVDPD